MEFRDLKKQYNIHKEEINQAIENTLTNANFIMGQNVMELESALADYVGTKHCITCGNGTDALQLALMTWNIGCGDVVFVPDFTFFSSGEVVSLCGATPVFVDIDKSTFNMNPEALECAIEEYEKSGQLSPKAIIAVDMFGQPADYERLCVIAKKHNLYLLEDGAQGLGGKIGNKMACSFGDIATTSFFPAKPLGCYGDGGAIFTDNDTYADILRSLRIHGKGHDKYDNIRIGMNSRLDTMQAAILKVKLGFLEEEIEACNKAAAYYTELLQDIVITPFVKEGVRSSWAQYTICVHSMGEREAIMKELKKRGIPSAVYYKKPMHRQVAFEGKMGMKAACPETDQICNVCLSLPMHAYLEKSDIEMVSNIIIEVLQ